MKKLIKIILWLPIKVLQIIWRIIWNIIQTILVVAIIAFALIYYSDHSDSKLANDIANLRHKVELIYNTWGKTESDKPPITKKL
ncbi:hypothetical protein N1495_04425 [Streptococcus didelphis]|uniref:Protease n=1 Tax=Streptococcus didelphis TaxID=102886 RepID=A0ABY9LH42_9STRE|nr:hypothetical protein [Streptococcus didelphis]WMB28152.1 hypothetical protein N1496_09890 [Streptococcus didelphis]WMB28162.1 hypothetical protein N1496_00015 [Streptococcus didelphis]WMB30075.1 hypothetical protein N1495_04425 [Streptococcus didelphis]